MLLLSLAIITAIICSFCVWKALQEPEVLSISATPPKDRP